MSPLEQVHSGSYSQQVSKYELKKLPCHFTVAAKRPVLVVYRIVPIVTRIDESFNAGTFWFLGSTTVKVWNALPQHLKDSTLCMAFKKCLKTHLFRLAH